MLPRPIYRPNIKPAPWGPVSAVRNAVRSYFEDTVGCIAPVLYLPFWEGAGSILHSVGTFSPEIPSIGGNWEGNGFAYNGTSDYSDIGETSGIEGATELTIIAGLTIHSYDSDGAFLRKANSSSQAFSFGQDTSNEIRGFANDATQSELYIRKTTDSPTVFNKFQVYAITWAASPKSMKFYTDGIQSATSVVLNGDPTSIASTSEHLTIAARYNGGSVDKYSDCNMHVLSLFGEALSHAQIALLHAEPYAAIQPKAFPFYFFFGAAVGGPILGEFSLAATSSLTDLGIASASGIATLAKTSSLVNLGSASAIGSSVLSATSSISGQAIAAAIGNTAIATTSTISDQAAASASGRITISTDSGLSFSGLVNAIGLIALSTTGTITIDRDPDGEEVSITLASTSAISNQASATALGNAILGITSNLTPLGIVQAVGLVSLASSSGLLISATGLEITTAVTLAMSSTLAKESTVSFVGNVSLDTSTALLEYASADANGSLSVGIDTSLLKQATAEVIGELTLNQTAGLVFIGGILFDAGITIASVSSIETAGDIVTFVATTPDSRIIKISAEIRVLPIDLDDRTITIH